MLHLENNLVYLQKYSLDELGLFRSAKTQAGSRVNFTGFTLDTVRKTIQVHQKTVDKIKRLVKEHISPTDAGQRTISFKHLEELLGVVNFAAKTSPLGRTKMFHLIGLLNDARDLPGNLVSITEQAWDELIWWQNEQQVLPMQAFKVTGARAEAFSDASGDYFAAKANSKQTCGPFPDTLKDAPIAVKEAYALKQAVKMLNFGQVAYLYRPYPTL